MAGKWKDLIDRTFGKVGTKRRDEQDKRVKEELAKMPSRSEAFVKAAHTFVNLTDGKLVALGEFRELLITGMELSATTVKEVAEVGRTTTRYVEEWIEGTSRPTRGQQCWVVEMLMKKCRAEDPSSSWSRTQMIIDQALSRGKRAGNQGKEVVSSLRDEKLLKPMVEISNLDELINKKMASIDIPYRQATDNSCSMQVLDMLTDLGVI